MDHLQPAVLAAVLIGGYLLGSIPFGLIAAHVGGAGDIRKVGSGNIGATNVLRTGRKDLALITLICDGGKGAAAALLAGWLVGKSAGAEAGHIAQALAGAAAFLGHLFPVWLKFKGGKGVATFFGTLLAVAWPVGVVAGGIWLIVAWRAKLSSLAALAASALSPVLAFVLHAGHAAVALAAFMAVLIFIRHHQNIARLLNGTEPRIGAGKAAAKAA